jgi:hypothetical protein
MTALQLFIATFGLVFALGLQSLNVNGGHKLFAFLTSLLIGASNLLLFKVLPGPTNEIENLAYLFGGPFGIVTSMVAHPVLLRLWKREPKPAPGNVAEAGRRAMEDMDAQRAATARHDAQVAKRVIASIHRHPGHVPPRPFPSAEPAADRMHTVNGAHMRSHERLHALACDLCSPDGLGRNVTEEVRNAARAARGLPTVTASGLTKHHPL